MRKLQINNGYVLKDKVMKLFEETDRQFYFGRRRKNGGERKMGAEIKYRAWIKNADKMVDVIAIDLEKEEICWIFDDYVNWEQERVWIGFDDVALMQFTGVQDKNGEEIYEGDIVSFEDSDGGYEYQDLVINTGIVEYGELRFYFTNRVAVEMDDFYIKDGRCDDIEVLGNIYENPELLEVQS